MLYIYLPSQNSLFNGMYSPIIAIKEMVILITLAVPSEINARTIKTTVSMGSVTAIIPIIRLLLF